MLHSIKISFGLILALEFFLSFGSLTWAVPSPAHPSKFLDSSDEIVSESEKNDTAMSALADLALHEENKEQVQSTKGKKHFSLLPWKHQSSNADIHSGVQAAFKDSKNVCWSQGPTQTSFTRSGQLVKVKRVSDADLTDDLEDWESSPFLRKNFPYALTGYEEVSGSPIWQAQFGRMDLRTIVETGGQMLKDFDTYTKQAAYRIMKSIRNSSTPDRPVNEALFLLDCDGFELRQVYLPNLQLLVKLAFRYSDLVISHLGPSVIVNANFLAEGIIRLIKPAFGPAMARIEVFGTKKRHWVPEVRRVFGPDQIPELYGGSNKDFKPIAMYG